MGMNKTELMALKWLKQQGYKDNEILRKSNTSPDFVCADSKRYEVKFLYGDKLIFSYIQSKTLKDDDIILVFDRDKFISKFYWKDRDKTNFNVYIMKPVGTSMQVDTETLEKLKQLKITKRESYNEIINRLMVTYNAINAPDEQLKNTK